MKVLVFAERTQSFFELCAGARQLADRVEVLVVGNASQAEEVKKVADKLWFIQPQEQTMVEDYTETITALVGKEKPDLLLIEPSKRIKLIAGRLAANIGTAVIPNVVDLTQESEISYPAVSSGVAPQGAGDPHRLLIKHFVYGGLAVRSIHAVAATAIAWVKPGVFDAGSKIRTAQGDVESIKFIEPEIKIRVIKREQKPKRTVDLTRSRKVVAIGRGIAKEEDLGMIQQLAEVIGGDVGCTKPITEEKKWMPRDAYIGISGITVKPEAYLAIGVSGQFQHVIGMNRSRVVIAINKDEYAPIFEHADYGFVGDLYKVVPALIDHLEKEKLNY